MLLQASLRALAALTGLACRQLLLQPSPLAFIVVQPYRDALVPGMCMT